MQAGKLKYLIECYSEALGVAGSGSVVTLLNEITSVLGKAGTQTAASFISTIEKIPFKRSGSNGPQVAEIVPLIAGLVAILKAAGPDKLAVADLELLLDLLRRRSEVSIKDFKSSVLRSVAAASGRKAEPGAPLVDTKQLVENYLQRLEAALGNDGMFQAVYRELIADKNVTKTEAIEIASRFLSPLPASTTRPKALQKILYRHEKLLDSRSASSSIGGKAA